MFPKSTESLRERRGCFPCLMCLGSSPPLQLSAVWAEEMHRDLFISVLEFRRV